jgi:hypothetical protein
MSLLIGVLGSQITAPPLLVQYLIVAGGGGGGGATSGGTGGAGGGGGFRTSVPGDLNPPDPSYAMPEFRNPDPQFAALTNTPYTITVGAGGSAGATNSSQNGASGSNSRFASVTIFGGGGGGNGPAGNGLSGGSGGGGGGGTTITSGGGRAERQGYVGGSGRPTSGFTSLQLSGPGGGAGGYFGRYETPYTTIPYGADPMESSLGGVYAAGGGGGTRWTSASGWDGYAAVGNVTYGGVLDFATNTGSAGTSGGINTGHGGGGSGGNVFSGGNGGSGIVIISIPSFYTASFSNGVTQTSTISGSRRVYTITATTTTSETITFLG